MSTISASDARSSLPELLDRVSAGEEVTITRHGKSVAVLVRPDVLRARRAAEALRDAERVRAALREGARAPLPSGDHLSPERADALVVDVRSARDRA